MDVLHDQLFDGRKIRILATIDTFSRFSLRWIGDSRLISALRIGVGLSSIST